MDGFKAFYVVVSADNTVTSLSLFTNKAAAESSAQKLNAVDQSEPRATIDLTPRGD
jgi:hypothetical protein